MKGRIAVHTALAEYAVALAELPLSAEASPTPAGAVVVVDGRGHWLGASVAAMDAGAIAVVVSNPGVADPRDVDLLASRAEAAGIPLLVERTLLRTDAAAAVAESLGAASAAVVAECHAPEAARGGALRDAV